MVIYKWFIWTHIYVLDFNAYFVIHLLWAVEYIYCDTKSTTQIFSCFCLASSCRTSRTSTHHQMKWLEKQDKSYLLNISFIRVLHDRHRKLSVLHSLFAVFMRKISAVVSCCFLHITTVFASQNLWEEVHLEVRRSDFTVNYTQWF